MFGKTEELIIVLLIILLLFGAKRIPDLARSIGKAAKEVRRGFAEDPNDKDDDKESESKEGPHIRKL